MDSLLMILISDCWDNLLKVFTFCKNVPKLIFFSKEKLLKAVKTCLNNNNKKLDAVLNRSLVTFWFCLFLKVVIMESHRDDFSIFMNWEKVKLLVKVSCHFLKCTCIIFHQIHGKKQ